MQGRLETKVLLDELWIRAIGEPSVDDQNDADYPDSSKC